MRLQISAEVNARENCQRVLEGVRAAAENIRANHAEVAIDLEVKAYLAPSQVPMVCWRAGNLGYTIQSIDDYEEMTQFVSHVIVFIDADCLDDDEAPF
jgi:hypothetical protein